MDDILSLGLWIKRRRKALDLTQDDLARQVGCSLETIRKIEGDARRPSRQVAVLLAEHLALPEEERDDFIRCARAELSVDRLPPPAQSMPRAAFVPATHTHDLVEESSPWPLPSGTVTFLFTDIEGSTQLWERHRTAMSGALDRHDTILRRAIADHGGALVKTTGDGIHAAFARATDALAAALAAQQALHHTDWGTIGSLRVRMALHTGVAEERGGDYYGPALNRAARLLAVAHGGQILLSRAVWELACDHLPPGITLLDVGEHQLHDLSRPERIFQLVAPDLPSNFPPLRTLDARPNNLPAQPTALIGREREIAAVTALLRRDDVRLLTLTGPGGTGKTRLALQVAAELLDTFVDGVWFIDLAPISDPELVAMTIAHALGVVEAAGRLVDESLRAFLRAKRALMLLDNFEQVIDAAVRVAELLAMAPQLKVLVTSRAVLQVYGEHEYAVPPLALPPIIKATAFRERTELGKAAETVSHPIAEVSVAELTQYEAVRLFIARARAAKADFAVTNDNAPAVAEICHRLDGLPLAIELAAARSKLFAPDVLLARLDHRLHVLTGGPRDLPARQQTLRNTIVWSYDLLHPGEQALFRRLGVFVGGSMLEAVEAICARVEGWERGTEIGAPIAHPQLPTPVLDTMASLVNQSLLRQEDGPDGMRFVMLETVREYALEQLAASNELATRQRRHAAYFLALAESAELALQGPEQRIWLDRLESELDNLRAALNRSLEYGEVETTARLGTALYRFWDMRDHLREGLGWMAAMVARGDALPPAVRAKTFYTTGRLRWRQETEDELVQAHASLTESLALYRELGDQQRSAAVLTDLGYVALELGDYLQAAAVLNESLALCQALEDKSGSAWALLWLGYLASRQHDGATAHRRFAESLALQREIGDQWGMAWALSALGRLNLAQGDYATARELQEERLAIEQALRHKAGVIVALQALAAVALAEDDTATAREYAEASLALGREVGDHPDVVGALQTMGDLALAERNYATARTWYEETLELCRARESGLHRADAAWALICLGFIAWREGDARHAVELFEESLELFRSVGDSVREGVAYALYWLGSTAVSENEQQRGRALLVESLTMFQEIDHHAGQSLCVAGLAAVAAAGGQLERATRLCGAAEGEIGVDTRTWWLDRDEYDRTLAAIRTQLDHATFTAAWAEGQAMTQEQAVAYALGEDL